MKPCALAIVAAAGCLQPEVPDERACGREDRRTFPVYVDRAIDLLVVLDRTPSMAERDATLRANAPYFANILQQVEGGLPDLHMAVVTSDLGGLGVAGCASGDGGRFLGAERCGLTRRFLAARNGDAGLAAAFSCLLDVPLSTCPVSQPIGALVRALDGTNPSNDGFRREDAYLVFLIITDSDDCSLIDRDALAGLGSEAEVDVRCATLGEPALASIEDSIDWLRPIDPARLIGSLIAGDAPRLEMLEAALPERFTSNDVRGPNWGDALIQLGGWGPAVGNSCFEGGIDLELGVPGIQPRCEGTFSTKDGSRRLPWCHELGATTPCMRAIEDQMWCPGDVTRIVVDIGDRRIPGGAWADVRCELPCDS